MFELKRLSDEAIPAALEKALRYRLLNEPAEPRVFVTMCSKSIRKTNRRWSFCCWH